MGEGCAAGKNVYCYGDSEVTLAGIRKDGNQVNQKVPFDQALLFCIRLKIRD
jgi:hypothetical protein